MEESLHVLDDRAPKDLDSQFWRLGSANWAIEHATTKFTPEQKQKIRNSALRSYLKDALAKVDSTAVKGENLSRPHLGT